MSCHLTKTQIEDFNRQSLSAVELLSVSDHLSICAACRQQIQRTLNGDAAYLALRSGLFSSHSWRAHLTFEQAAGLVDSTLAGDEFQVASDHLAICQECLLAVDDLRAFKVRIEPELDRQFSSTGVAHEKIREKIWLLQFWPISLVSALAVLLFVASGWIAWHALQENSQKTAATVNQGTPSSERAETVPAGAGPALAGEIAMLRDGEGEVMLDTAGRLSGVDQLPPAYQQMIKRALSGLELERPARGLAAESGIPRGNVEEAVEKFSLIEPVRTVTLSDHPTFRWTRLQGATGYVVEIYDGNFDLVTSSPRLSEPKWHLPQALKRGASYYWQVKAINEGKESTSPQPAPPQSKFRVLDEAKARELEQARRSYGSSHLLLGLIYAESGLLDEAEAEFRALQKANPDSAIPDRLVHQVRQR
ncbi:MAG: hypothetical protein J2P31_17585 [Blastocatellia bacterium]|nr:hypothetical protein [Blastocatellia bacterium]